MFQAPTLPNVLCTYLVLKVFHETNAGFIPFPAENFKFRHQTRAFFHFQLFSRDPDSWNPALSSFFPGFRRVHGRTCSISFLNSLRTLKGPFRTFVFATKQLYDLQPVESPRKIFVLVQIAFDYEIRHS